MIDDDVDFSNMYSYLIRSLRDFELTRCCTEIVHSLNYLKMDQPDLILIGMGPSRYDEIDLLPKVYRYHGSVEVILIADFLEDEVLTKAIQYGVAGYLLRKSTMVEVEECLRQVADGNGFVNGSLAKVLLKSYRKNYFSPLTTRETEVLHHLSGGKTYSMIAETMGIAGGTVKVHIKNIYSKLVVNTKAGAIAKARDIKILK